MSESNLDKFTARYTALVADGVTGAEVYRRLAVDPLAPAFLDESELAELIGLKPTSLAMRRFRKMEPAYVAISARAVRYPRHAICEWLATTYRDQGQERRDREAA